MCLYVWTGNEGMFILFLLFNSYKYLGVRFALGKSLKSITAS
jgi:hypothetical protein